MSTAIKKPTDSSSTSPIVPEQHSCSDCSLFANSQSGSVTEALGLFGYVAQLSTMQKELNLVKAGLEAQKTKTADFYQSITKLSKTVQKAIWFLLVIPVLQLIGCTVAVFYLGIQENLPSLINWVLGGVSVLSIAEMIMLPIKFMTMENRMNDIERKLSDRQDAG